MGGSPIMALFLLVISISSMAALGHGFDVPTITFDQGYSPLFGNTNLVRSPDGQSVRLLLDRSTGSGFISTKFYDHGFFSASIKLPSNYTAGVVVAFYTSNGDQFEKSHDELDFEFLGSVKGGKWRLQTNVYGNGSTNRGREERYLLWFDPTQDFHRYSILWTKDNIIFYIDDVPIREMVRSEALGGDYPSKPMSLYATIWDGSPWATNGGRDKVDYKYAPFVAEFSDLSLEGCTVDPIQLRPSEDCAEQEAKVVAADYAALTPGRRSAMRDYRRKYMTYFYCYDTQRYQVPLPECVIDPAERSRFAGTGRAKFGGHRHGKRRSRASRVAPESRSQSSM